MEGSRVAIMTIGSGKTSRNLAVKDRCKHRGNEQTSGWQQCLDIFFFSLLRSAPSSAQDTCSQVGILPKGAQGHPRAQDHHTAQHLASIGMKSALVDLLGVACQAIVSNGKSHKAGSISNHRGPTDTPHTHTHPDHYPST